MVLSSNKKQKTHYGYKENTLLTEIPFIKCIPDTLHSRLRIPGALIKLLIKELALIDKYYGKDIIDFNTHKNLTKWYFFFKNDCKINKKL